MTQALLFELPPVMSERTHKTAKPEGVAKMLYELMTENPPRWWTLPELERALAVRGRRVLATSISARLRDLRRRPWNAYVVSRSRHGGQLQEYAVGLAGMGVCNG